MWVRRVGSSRPIMLAAVVPGLAGREGIGVRRGSPTIKDNTISRTRGNGIEVRQTDAWPSIVGNTIVDAGQVGINLVAGTARVEGNTVERAGGAAISVTGSTDLDASASSRPRTSSGPSRA